jgi:protein-S-isoprenylcysteine O-methyltransferase Ste14
MRILPPVLVVIALVVMMLLAAFAPLVTVARYPWNLLGLVPAIAGLALAIAGRLQFARRGTQIGSFDEHPSVLVTDGVFRFSRNPMYLGLVLFLAGAALLLRAASPWPVVALFAIVVDRWHIRFEEKVVRRAFGEAYERYAATTRRWL